MAVTNLTGYTWVADGYQEISDYSYNVTFTCDDDVFETFDVSDSYMIYYDTTRVYDVDYGSGWVWEGYKTITFTGGDDISNSSLIAYLEANGTLTPPPPPANIAEKLLAVNQVKQDIKDAIETKGADLTGVDFGGYAEKITELPLPKEEQTKTVTSPDFSSANFIDITPDAGKVLTKATVVKSSYLTPENIVKDVNIFGVVGTAEKVVELTQAQYNALSVYDNKTYYLIVEV